MQHLLDTLAALPAGALLGAMALLAAIENVFPPIPADVLVAFGGFLAARQHVSPWPAFLCVWLGNVAGAVAMFLVGRRYGAEWTERRFHLAKGGTGDQRILGWYQRYGTPALFVSRFVPGVRSIVPPVAGALRIPLPRVAFAVAAASGLWYGAINYLAFTAGSNWESLARSVGIMGRWTAIGASIVVVIVGGLLWWRRRRS
ncbi:MAG: DedA family protein [Gemmatimonadaceae bacterium]